ncbi:MAG: DUF475 domain-containing protein [Candidatus Buchananbacteria bacterium]|nr:DUF475 domain-containing protein [Candidatus Buchananbacteria bacterium]
MFSALIVILGLILFEVISSVDNAIINAHVLKTMPEKYRRIFMTWGIIFAVFIVRGILPFIIIWLANSTASFSEILALALSTSEEAIEESLHHSKALLLLGGGMYLFFVSLGWLFLEEKKYAFRSERWIHARGFWFYAIASLVLTTVIYYAVKENAWLALSASIGASAFFITDGFKKNAEEKEKALLDPHVSAWSKILYLEILDASFSIDGVIGAFAFTLSIPLIIIGNGIGAFVVRELTVKGIDVVAKLAYLKNGAMYSIGVLGTLMILESFGREYPFWLAPLNTMLLLVIFLALSYRELKRQEKTNSL